MVMLIQALTDGLLIGGVYASIAVGLSLSYGVMRMINWAQGQLLMLSMYIAYLLISLTGMNPYIAMFPVAAIMAMIAWALQSTAFNKILSREKEREPISLLLFTAGLGMFITNIIICTIGATPLSIRTDISGKVLEVGPLLISAPRLIAFVIATTFTLALYFFIRHSELGRAIRATSQNRQVATLMGINQKNIYKIAFAISIGLLGFSGTLLIPYFPVGTTLGETFNFKAFMIVVLGGKGSVLGALLGGLIVGIIEKVVSLYSSDTYAQIAIFIVFILILLFKPNGLMGEKDIK